MKSSVSRSKLTIVASVDDPGVRGLLEQPNCGVISTLNGDGSIHAAVVWVGLEQSEVTVNSAAGRLWPTNLARDPHVSLLVVDAGNQYHYVEIRGTATETRAGADEHINALTKKYIGQDEYPFRQPGEERVKFVIAPEHVRYVKQ
jgi:PPOX class probable F420-dependent enzyme